MVFLQREILAIAILDKLWLKVRKGDIKQEGRTKRISLNRSE